MKLTDRLSPITSAIFLIAMVIVTLVLTYMVVQANKVSNNWQKTNDQAAQLIQEIK